MTAATQLLDSIVPTVRTRLPRGADMYDRNDCTRGNEPAHVAGIHSPWRPGDPDLTRTGRPALARNASHGQRWPGVPLAGAESLAPPSAPPPTRTVTTTTAKF